jgi:hypothetical protein
VKSYLTIVAIAFIILAGCQTSSEYQYRYSDAMQIVDVSSRDVAMKNLAIDAANHSQSPWTLSALDEIVNVQLKDSTAQICALKLNSQGQHDAAEECAQVIVEPAIRDKTFSQLSAGATATTQP